MQLLNLIMYKKILKYRVRTNRTHTKTVRLDISANQRLYTIPTEAVKILDIRCKDHQNNSSKYQSIPRSIYEPETEDSDGL